MSVYYVDTPYEKEIYIEAQLQLHRSPGNICLREELKERRREGEGRRGGRRGGRMREGLSSDSSYTIKPPHLKGLLCPSTHIEIHS